MRDPRLENYSNDTQSATTPLPYGHLPEGESLGLCKIFWETPFSPLLGEMPKAEGVITNDQ